MLLNLASVVNAEQPDMLWGFIRRYVPGASPETEPLLAKLVDRAIAYYRDFVRPEKHYRDPTPMERAALQDLADTLSGIDDSSAEGIQNVVFEVGKRHPFPESAVLVRRAVPDPAGSAGGTAVRRLRCLVRGGGNDRADPVGAGSQGGRGLIMETAQRVSLNG